VTFADPFADPLADAVASVGDATVPDERVRMELPPNVPLPEDPSRRRFLLYVGLFDLLAEASLARSETDDGRTRLLESALTAVRSAEPALRFARHERSQLTERREVTARMRGKDIALTSEWMLPRLRQDIDRYQARIAALRAALEKDE